MKYLLVAVCLILAFHYGEADVSCDAALADIYPCLSYLSQGGNVPETCCNGVRALNSRAQTPVDRRSVCRCIISAIGGVSPSPDNLNNALTLPAKCGADLPFRISPSTNCDSIK